MKFVVLTGNSLRHKKFVDLMYRQFHPELVVYEEKRDSNELAKKEPEYFPNYGWTPPISVNCGTGRVNSKQVESIIKSIESSDANKSEPALPCDMRSGTHASGRSSLINLGQLRLGKANPFLR